MPKDDGPHLKDIKKIRMEKRAKRFNTQPTTIYWQVLGSGTYGGPTSLYLYTDHRRYMFNCGEGTQRLTSQLSLSRAMAQLEHVFITSKTWKHLGGLPGLCLTVRSCGAPGITIHGPQGCMELYDASKAFLTLFDFDVEAHTLEDGDFEDGAVKVETIVLSRDGKLDIPPIGDDWREDGHEPSPNHKNRKTESSNKKTAQFDKKPEYERKPHYESDVHAYLCHFSPRPGKLDINKCVELGIKPGPQLGELKAGQDVTLEDGRLVRSQDVVGDSAPASSYLVLDLPAPEYLHNLAGPRLAGLASLQPALDTVFHFSPPEVVSSAEYRQFCTGLGPAVKHVMLNESCRGLGMSDVSSYSYKLRSIRSELFPPMCGADDCVSPADLAARMSRDRAELGANTVRGVTGLKLMVRPLKTTSGEPDHNQVDDSDVIIYDEKKAAIELSEGGKDRIEKEDYIKGMKAALEYAKQYKPSVSDEAVTVKDTAIDDLLKTIDTGVAESMDQDSGGNPIDKLLKTIDKGESESMDQNKEGSIAPEEYPKITFLGTGSSVPSKYRNVTCILVETAPDSFIMMDCGEGSMGQMVRLFGVERTKQILRQLRCVYISHMHADHHLGLISVIQLRERAVAEAGGGAADKLYVVSTDRLIPFLIYYHDKFESLLSGCKIVKAEWLILYSEMDADTWEHNHDKKLQRLFPDQLAPMLERLGCSEFYVSRAIHCPHAFCVAFRTRAGYKIAYSGDTRPCVGFREVATWGGPPDLLIHEATMEHFMMYDAIIKKHSTFTEAINEGKVMNAGFTMLTHFSQRYAKMPMLTEIEGHQNVGISFDMMQVNRSTLNLIPSIYPALEKFLEDYKLELQDRADQYKQKHSGLDLPTPEEDFEERQKTEKGVRRADDTQMSPLERKKRKAEELAKKHEEKHQWYNNMKLRKTLEMQQESSISQGKQQSSLDNINTINADVKKLS